jgi:hypothetical protein
MRARGLGRDASPCTAYMTRDVMQPRRESHSFNSWNIIRWIMAMGMSQILIHVQLVVIQKQKRNSAKSQQNTTAEHTSPPDIHAFDLCRACNDHLTGQHQMTQRASEQRLQYSHTSGEDVMSAPFMPSRGDDRTKPCSPTRRCQWATTLGSRRSPS